MEYLFSIDAALVEENLNKCIISVELRKAFKTKGFPLSKYAIMQEIADKWEITDGEKIYIVKKEERSAFSTLISISKDTAPLPLEKLIYHKMKTRCKDFLLRQIFKNFPHSEVWRVLVTFAFVIIGLVLWKVLPLWNVDLMDLVIIDKPLAPWAILSLWGLILYLSLILWLPFHNIWECIERVEYYAVEEKEFRQKISGSLNVVSTLVAFSIAFIVVSLSIITPSTKELNVIKIVMGLLIAGVIFLVVTMEAYGVSLNPAFDSAQIARLYTKGWWFYTFGLYSIVIALLLYVYLLEPLITIIGVSIFIVAFTICLRTQCNIKPKYQKW